MSIMQEMLLIYLSVYGSGRYDKPALSKTKGSPFKLDYYCHYCYHYEHHRHEKNSGTNQRQINTTITTISSSNSAIHVLISFLNWLAGIVNPETGSVKTHSPNPTTTGC